MRDFEDVKQIRGPKLADLREHVRDVLAISLAEEDEYQVGKLAMASFDFVPFALSGLAAAMQAPVSGARASTHVILPLTDDQGGAATAEQDVTLFGPGDVLGLEGAQIVRRYPPPGSTNAEETFHAHIEFDRPELPWAFSAAAPAARMPTWLVLVVFERSEVTWESASAGLLPILSVPAALLPPLAQAWAFAHAQAAAGPAALSARLSTAHAPVNLARLLAARVLTQNTNYVACLVPATDAGRKAGLGLGAGGLGPAWTPADGIVRLPVYDRWEFRTAPDGDFARLARRLQGVAAPWQVGRRRLNASKPGEPLGELDALEAGRQQTIRCALFSPAAPPASEPADDARFAPARTGELEAALERPALLEGTAGTHPGEIPDLPLVGPRIYAKAQRASGTLAVGGWFAELNLSPVHRVVAGVGTRVVQKDQEALMQAAWAQVGEVEKANRELNLAEFARHLAASAHARLSQLEVGRLLQITRPLAARVRLDGASLTLCGQVARSATPTAALGGAFRRALRFTGPMLRRLEASERSKLCAIVSHGERARDFSRPYRELDGIGGLSAAAVASLEGEALSLAFRTSAEQARSRVGRAAVSLSRGLSLATAATTPSVWKDPDLSFKPGAAAAARVVSKLQALVPANPKEDLVRARWIGGLSSAVAATGVAGSDSLRAVSLRLEAASVAASTGSVALSPMTPVSATARSTSATMLRGAAARSALSDASPSGRLDSGVTISIVRPAATSALDAAGATEAARLERFRTPQGTLLATWLEVTQRVTVTDLRSQLSALVSADGALALRPTPQRDLLAVRREDLLHRLEPRRTILEAVRARIGTNKLAFDPFEGTAIRPIMAAPRFNRPMYQALDAYDREWLVPGLGTLPQPELVTLLSTNDVFTEAFLVGLSDEMGRELLWRGYPTDSRGTYFRRFWDGSQDELAQDIHRFSNTALGSHVKFGPPGQSGRAVVVIRGEVVRRYPDLLVMALAEDGREEDGRPRLPEVPTGPPNAARSLFHAMLEPDVMLVGLDITIDALRAPGWWIVLSEHPQATRFRRQEPDLAAHEVAFGSPEADAATTGATEAWRRLESPTRIAFEAADFLPPPS